MSVKVDQNISDFLHLFFPHYCTGCGQSLSPSEKILCIKCLNNLPETSFHLINDNPVAHLFIGRVAFHAATASYLFHKASVLQNIIHGFKYKGRKDVAYFMGRQMGKLIKASFYVKDIEGIVPVPLYDLKERKRGYNQAALLARGISEICHYPVLEGTLKRRAQTATQTHLNRLERWENVKNAFKVIKPEMLQGKHVLLVDDVITTGATMEACAQRLIEIPGVEVSMAALALARN